MRGFITEIDFELVDQCFPGIGRYYRELKEKPKTFLELLWRFLHREPECCATEQVAVAAATDRAAS